MATKIEAAELLTMQAADLKIRGKKALSKVHLQNITLQKFPYRLRQMPYRFLADTDTQKIFR